jgi:hypothetical protein
MECHTVPAWYQSLAESQVDYPQVTGLYYMTKAGLVTKTESQIYAWLFV